MQKTGEPGDQRRGWQSEYRRQAVAVMLWIVLPTVVGGVAGYAFFAATAGAAIFGLPALAAALLLRSLLRRCAPPPVGQCDATRNHLVNGVH